MPSPHVFVFVGLSEAALAQGAGAVQPNQILGYGGFLLALVAAFFAYQRDRRDRRDERERQDRQHAANQAVMLALTAKVDDLHRDLHRKGGLLDKEIANSKTRHDRRNDVLHFQLRFAHNEQWMEEASRCHSFPLPPFKPLPRMPQRRQDDAG